MSSRTSALIIACSAFREEQITIKLYDTINQGK